ncbi:Bug family tripartite tricarboxylate transporter substrate binding protein [Halomonas sp. E14]|uniref:Bug family tripartite tricarboxylate transporter substrate binding protein n=1 Tax=Halomonas sp. E14 TaxID=3397245 RepID=UPI00403EE41B
MRLNAPRLLLVTAAPLSLMLAGLAVADDYPSKPITLIVGASAGGTTDALAREVAEGLSQKYDVPTVVDNRPGAGANIAAQAVANSDPDGYTLLVAYTSHTLNASLFHQLPYDPVEDFSPISLLGEVSSILLSRPDLEVESLQGLLDYAAEQPDGITFGVGGLGSSLHMETLKFMQESGVLGYEIPYNGTAPAIADLIGSHMDVMFAPFAAAMPLVESGDANAIAVTSPERMPNLDHIPSVNETLSDYPTTYGWFGLLGPAGMDPAIVERLNADVTEIMQGESGADLLEREGAEPIDISAEAFATFIAEDIERWQAIAEAGDIEKQ